MQLAPGLARRSSFMNRGRMAARYCDDCRTSSWLDVTDADVDKWRSSARLRTWQTTSVRPRPGTHVANLSAKLTLSCCRLRLQRELRGARDRRRRREEDVIDLISRSVTFDLLIFFVKWQIVLASRLQEYNMPLGITQRTGCVRQNNICVSVCLCVCPLLPLGIMTNEMFTGARANTSFRWFDVFTGSPLVPLSLKKTLAQLCCFCQHVCCTTSAFRLAATKNP